MPDLTLAYLKRKDAESKEAQEPANSSALGAVRLVGMNIAAGDVWLSKRGSPVLVSGSDARGFWTAASPVIFTCDPVGWHWEMSYRGRQRANYWRSIETFHGRQLRSSE